MDNIDQVKIYVENIKNSLKLGQNDLRLKKYIVTDIKLLSGGLVNYVYRISFETSKNKATVILKYFPPFLAINKSVAFSQERYHVEKSALSLLTDSPWLKINQGSIARTPQLFYSDDQNYVIIIEDVGEKAQTLLNLLTKNSKLNNQLITQLAKEVKFFIEYLTKYSGITPVNHIEFENKPVSDMLDIYWKRTWQVQSVSLSLEAELASYLKISGSLFEAPNLTTDSVVWTFGDLWPNSILIDEEANRIWFIDWEASRFQVDPLRDLEQLMANLWLMKQNSDIYDIEKINFLIEELQDKHFGARIKDWRSLSSDRKDKFIIWILGLIKEEHWKIENSKEVMLKALDEIKNI